MKKFSILFYFVITALIIAGCGNKQESAGNDTKTSEKNKKVEKKDISLDDNSSFHITYNMNKEGKGMTLDLYRKGKKIKSEASTTGEKMPMKSSAYYFDKMMFMVTDMNGKKFGMKMNLENLPKKEDGDVDKMLFDAKDRLKEYEKTGTAEVLGYPCDIYKDKKGNTFYFYKEQAVLKMETNHGTMEATKFEPDVKLEDSFFEPPKDVEYMETGKLDLNKLKDLNVK